MSFNGVPSITCWARRVAGVRPGGEAGQFDGNDLYAYFYKREIDRLSMLGLLGAAIDATAGVRVGGNGTGE